jgi:fatty acid desaturase
MIRRTWTPGEADEWTKEDWIAVVLSVASYILLMIGTALAFLLNVWGFIILVLGIITTYLMHWIIDPKLKMVSEEYEKKQHDYLENLERKVRWEEIHG